ncbi:alanine racemase [Candidatus Omnitrophota bacterium]
MPDKNSKKKIIFYRPTWVEVNVGAIAYNFRQVRRIVGSRVKILAVVKADAYGHGMREVSQALHGCGADYFGVACIDEAIELRKLGITKPILIFESIPTHFAAEIINHNLIPTISVIPLADAINRYAKKRKKIARVHIKVDTGMGRLGVWHIEALDFIKAINAFSHLKIEGIYTHFSSADTDSEFTKQQIGDFKKLKTLIEAHKISIPLYHAANSMGVIAYPESHFDLVRPGLMLYGLYPRKGLTKKVTLKPAMSFKTKVMYVKHVSAGRSISYGRTYVTKRNTIIATLPVGYNDGYPRCLSNNAEVLLNGKRYKIAGRVCMDQLLIDVGSRSNVKINDLVTLLGNDEGGCISADELAEKAGTISYEIVCALGKAKNRRHITS